MHRALVGLFGLLVAVLAVACHPRAPVVYVPYQAPPASPPSQVVDAQPTPVASDCADLGRCCDDIPTSDRDHGTCQYTAEKGESSTCSSELGYYHRHGKCGARAPATVDAAPASYGNVSGCIELSACCGDMQDADRVDCNRVVNGRDGHVCGTLHSFYRKRGRCAH